MTTSLSRASLPAPASTLQRLDASLRPHGLAVVRAVPRAADHLLLTLVRSDGTRTAGQWFADPKRAERIAAQTRPPDPAVDEVRVVPGSGVVVQGGGCDRRLTSLRSLVRRPAAELLAHRPERRAVVRAGEVYTKVVRPERVTAIVSASRHAAAAEITVPALVATEATSGTLTTRTLPGRTLHELLGDPDAATDRVVAAAHTIGAALARLHAGQVPTEPDRHDAAAELAVTRRWLGLAHTHGLLPGLATGGLLERASRLLAGAPTEPAYLHRDLHDKQLLVDEDGAVGMLDFDLAAVGEPALDLANLLVHLDLRAVQGRCPPPLAWACQHAILSGYRPKRGVRRRLDAYALTTRLRLLAVYAFRPGSGVEAHSLLAVPVLPGRPLTGADRYPNASVS